MSISNYLEKVNKHYQSGHATEHTYRGDLAELVNTLVPDVSITNEPSNVTDCGNPDYVITRNRIPVGFIEAKDVGKDLNSKEYMEQFGRYKKALDNLIITDYIWFQFFQKGQLIHEIRIADFDGDNIRPLSGNFDQFANLMDNFCTFIAQTIKSPKTLAEMMAAKARLLENILENAITSDEINDDNSALQQQYETFKNILIHDLTPQGFADIYAQTLAYGMFAARLHDKTLDTFSRQEAAELIPKSNPFLRKLFGHVAGVDIDARIVTTVDNLADVFRATNVEALLKSFGRGTATQDPIIHFYETFLAEYDPKLRKARGVWYTPEPIVNFMVRGVDEILRSEFGLKDGLADTSKTTIKIQTDKPDRRTKSGYVELDKEVHRVQVLDPATGTGTFLAEVVKYVYSKKFQAMQGAWGDYVEEHLIPRLNGFELLMASYSMAHLKLDMLLAETGYEAQNPPRFNIFLTNSLEEYHPDTGTLFSTWLSTEANEANNVKRDTPVMVVMGNPPYSVSSSNNSEWIQGLVADYKKDLNEQNIQPLSDDYIKFIRYGQYFIEKNGEGVVAYISNNSFVDGVIQRKMRESLVRAFDKIIILNLHGSSKTNETTPEGKKDENVFDIMQGVSISFFIKNGSAKKSLASVKYIDLWGKREDKYRTLKDNDLSSLDFENIALKKPEFYLSPQDYDTKKEYDKGFSPTELFKEYCSGVQTEFDDFAVQESARESEDTLQDLVSLTEDEILQKYGLPTKLRSKVVKAKKDLLENPHKILEYSYRPFESRSILYTGKSNGIMGRPRKNLAAHFASGHNLSLIVKRARLLGKDKNFNHCFLSSTIIDKNFLADQSYCFPLHISTESFFGEGNDSELCPNLNEQVVQKLSTAIQTPYSPSDKPSENSITPICILDYIYAVLHSRKYRKKYSAYLRQDFPKIPYPKSKNTFFKMVEHGGKLRRLHLLEAEELESFVSTFPISGSNEVVTKFNASDWDLYDTENQLGRIRINEEQYFEGIPLKVWELSIGGFQPAQKWLKDRVGRQLSFDDILLYQKIIVSLQETVRTMQEIDKIDFA